jgi:hypothetical protein
VKEVELHPAFEWICDDCGQNNFSSAVVRVPTEDELKEFGDDGDGESRMIAFPDTVTCKFCEAEFVTIEPEFLE